jgi:hypothetical protein
VQVADQSVTGSAPETTALGAEPDADIAAISFSAPDIAIIGARIARGETKTEVIRTMPGYTARRHRTFVPYYEILYRACATHGLIDAPMYGKQARREA